MSSRIVTVGGGTAAVRVVVVGGGTMGAGIAAALVAAGGTVDLVEADAARAEAAGDAVAGILADGVRRDRLTGPERDAALARLAVHHGWAAVAPRPEAVIEAVPERLELKRAVLAAAEAVEPALLATNTSAISIDELAAELRAPERFIGMHFFNPVAAMRLVEIVVGERTSPDAVVAARGLVDLLGKEAIEVRDAPGFATTRLGVLLGLEAIRMVEDGVASPADIDRAMELGYRHPMGPLRLGDIVGLDVRLDIATQLAEAYGPRFAPPDLLRQMVADGRLGRKTGQGFYVWDDPAS